MRVTESDRKDVHWHLRGITVLALPGVLGVSLPPPPRLAVFSRHSGLQVALVRPTPAPFRGRVTSCVSWSLFMTVGVQMSNNRIGGLSGAPVLPCQWSPLTQPQSPSHTKSASLYVPPDVGQGSRGRIKADQAHLLKPRTHTCV